MFTANATISNVIVDSSSVWIQFEIKEKCFPVHCELNPFILADYDKLEFILKKTKTKNVNDLTGKNIRVIDTEATIDSLVAVGDISKDKFIDLYGSGFPVKERKIYRKYR